MYLRPFSSKENHILVPFPGKFMIISGERAQLIYLRPFFSKETPHSCAFLLWEFLEKSRNFWKSEVPNFSTYVYTSILQQTFVYFSWIIERFLLNFILPLIIYIWYCISPEKSSITINLEICVVCTNHCSFFGYFYILLKPISNN